MLLNNNQKNKLFYYFFCIVYCILFNFLLTFYIFEYSLKMGNIQNWFKNNETILAKTKTTLRTASTQLLVEQKRLEIQANKAREQAKAFVDRKDLAGAKNASILFVSATNNSMMVAKSRSHLEMALTQINLGQNTNIVAKSMKQANIAIKSICKQISVPEINQTLSQFEKQINALDIRSEIVNSRMGDVLIPEGGEISLQANELLAELREDADFEEIDELLRTPVITVSSAQRSEREVKEKEQAV
jgi:hypothetical protein